MMNIEVHNSDILRNGDLNMNRPSKVGIIISLCLSLGAGATVGYFFGNTEDIEVLDLTSPPGIEISANVPLRDQIFVADDEIAIPYEQEDPINVSLEEVNSLNIIINDNDCREDFINSVCEELDRDGIKYTFTKNGENIDVDNAVVITLDQQYMAGPATVVFAPLQNGRTGNSDALALAAQRAFYEKGFLVDGVACGQMGFRENDNGTISERIPTETESAIGTDKNTSFVTISFGTQNTHAGLTASSIEGMLTRYYSFITSGYHSSDLIYCVEDTEDYGDIAEKLGVTDSSVSSWKYGRAFPDFPNYLKLVILGMSPYEVMNGLLDIHARINDCKMRIERNKMDLNFMRGRSRYSGEEAQLLIAEIEREISELNEQIEELNSQLNNKIDELDKRTLELLRSKGLSNLNMKEENPA